MPATSDAGGVSTGDGCRRGGVVVVVRRFSWSAIAAVAAAVVSAEKALPVWHGRKVSRAPGNGATSRPPPSTPATALPFSDEPSTTVVRVPARDGGCEACCEQWPEAAGGASPLVGIRTDPGESGTVAGGNVNA
jgi:hypothetical protein